MSQDLSALFNESVGEDDDDDFFKSINQGSVFKEPRDASPAARVVSPPVLPRDRSPIARDVSPPVLPRDRSPIARDVSPPVLPQDKSPIPRDVSPPAQPQDKSPAAPPRVASARSPAARDVSPHYISGPASSLASIFGQAKDDDWMKPTSASSSPKKVTFQDQPVVLQPPTATIPPNAPLIPSSVSPASPNPPLTGSIVAPEPSSLLVTAAPNVVPASPAQPSPPRGLSSLIAARRAAAAVAEPVLIQPEKDVIYKQYNPNPPSTIPPPPGGPMAGFHGSVVTPPPQQPPPIVQSNPVHFPAVQTPSFQPPVVPSFRPPVVQSPLPQPPAVHSPLPQPPQLVRPTSAVSAPQNFSPVYVPTQPGPSLPVFSVDHSQSNIPAASTSRRPDGLQAKVHIGFGGRIVLFGGKLGMRVSMTTISDSLGVNKSSKKFLDIVKSAPTPLGSATQLCTEQLVAWIDSLGQNQSRFTHIPEEELLLMFLRDRLVGSTRRGLNRNLNMGIMIGEKNLLLQNIPNQSNLTKFVLYIVRGEMREMIELTKTVPSLMPFAMAIASIHSAEFFRESVLAFADSVGNESNVSTQTPLVNPLSPHDSTLLSILKEIIVIFASTAGAHRLEISPLTIAHWDLFLALIVSLTKPGGDSNGGFFLLRLGDELIRNKRIAAGQLCILLSGKKENTLDSVDSHDGLISLISVDHRTSHNFSRLCDPLAILLSEIFEYTWRMIPGSSEICIPLQPFKFIYAAFLAGDLGMFETAEKYLEIIQAFMRAAPTNRYSVHFRNAMRELEQRIAGTRPAVGTANQPRQNQDANLVGIADVGRAIWGGIAAVARTSRMI